MTPHEQLADDLRLAPAFEEYLVCKVYLDLLEHDQRPETSTLRSAVQTRMRSIGRRIQAAAGAGYPALNAAAIDGAANLILERQPVGKAFYQAKLPAL